jgi:hypothetical protein
MEKDVLRCVALQEVHDDGLQDSAKINFMDS